jgi:CIC family chloride channel protein
VGILASIFIKLMLLTKQLITWPLHYRLMTAGVLTGVVAIFYPQIMGTGYDTISATFNGQLSLGLLLGILIAKLLLTPIILGLGMPAGLIGPALLVGAVGGAALGIIGALLVDTPVSHVGLYAMLGMGSMMAAVLNAPLAALIALLELTYNPNIIFAGMIAIVVANLTTRYVFKMPPVFLAMLQAQGFDYRLEPLAQVLTRISIAKVMSKKFIQSSKYINLDTAQSFINSDYDWLVTNHQDKHIDIFPLADLSLFVERKLITGSELIDLDRLPAERLDIVSLNVRSTVYDALLLMNKKDADLLCIFDHTQTLIGTLSRKQIESYYNNKQYL